MAKTPISSRSKGERGAALLEAVIALGLVALIAAAGFSAFSAASRASDAAARQMTSLTLAENALERASAPAFLRAALETGEATLAGEDWRVEAKPYEADDGEGSLALIELTAIAEDVTLTTLRSLPR
ncbi:MAG: hypothetical protein AAFN79_00740 [Pseudomonadota bacterium]